MSACHLSYHYTANHITENVHHKMSTINFKLYKITLQSEKFDKLKTVENNVYWLISNHILNN